MIGSLIEKPDEGGGRRRDLPRTALPARPSPADVPFKVIASCVVVVIGIAAVIAYAVRVHMPAEGAAPVDNGAEVAPAPPVAEETAHADGEQDAEAKDARRDAEQRRGDRADSG